MPVTVFFHRYIPFGVRTRSREQYRALLGMTTTLTDSDTLPRGVVTWHSQIPWWLFASFSMTKRVIIIWRSCIYISCRKIPAVRLVDNRLPSRIQNISEWSSDLNARHSNGSLSPSKTIWLVEGWRSNNGSSSGRSAEKKKKLFRKKKKKKLFRKKKNNPKINVLINTIVCTFTLILQYSCLYLTAHRSIHDFYIYCVKQIFWEEQSKNKSVY